MVSEEVKELARKAHKNICPNADAYTFERGYIHGYEDALDKACEWLDWFLQEKVTTPGYEWVCKQVADFRKSMEE